MSDDASTPAKVPAEIRALIVRQLAEALAAAWKQGATSAPAVDARDVVTVEDARRRA